MGQLQIIKCKCGASVAACTIPECYEESDWMKDIRRYSKMGYSIDIVDAESFRFGKCSCIVEPSKNEKQIQLFVQ